MKTILSFFFAVSLFVFAVDYAAQDSNPLIKASTNYIFGLQDIKESQRLLTEGAAPDLFALVKKQVDQLRINLGEEILAVQKKSDLQKEHTSLSLQQHKKHMYSIARLYAEHGAPLDDVIKFVDAHPQVAIIGCAIQDHNVLKHFVKKVSLQIWSEKYLSTITTEFFEKPHEIQAKT